MNFLEERILKDGVVKEGNVLKVDSFLNHQMFATAIVPLSLPPICRAISTVS